MNTARFVLILTLSISTISSGYANCFRNHVRDGRSLNSERKYQYASWAKKHNLKRQAKLVSNALMGIETLMLPMARYYDYKARDYKQTGLFCDDFIDMKETPKYTEAYTQIPRVPFIKKLAFLTTYEKEVRRLVKNNKWSEIREQSLEVLGHFPAPETHCMSRHFVESLGRIAALAPKHIQAAKEQGLDNPSELIASMLRFHLFGLDYAAKIDALAAPLQYEGIPIVCQDVPFISIPEIDL